MEISLYGQNKAIEQIEDNIGYYKKNTKYEKTPYIEAKLKEKITTGFCTDIWAILFFAAIGGIIGAIMCGILMGLFKGFVEAAKAGGIVGAILGGVFGIIGIFSPDTTDEENEQIIKEANLQNEKIRKKKRE